MDISLTKEDQDRVKRLFGWEDSTIFLWSIRRSKIKPLSLFFATLKIFKWPFIIISFLLLIGIALPRISFWLLFIFTSIYLLSYIAVFIRYIVLQIPNFFGPSEIWKPKSSHYIYAVVICLGIALLILSPTSFFLTGFQAQDQIGIYDLMLFLVNNVFQVATIGIPESLGFKLSTISPSTYETKILIFIFRIMVAIGLIDLLAEILRRRFLKYEFFGTVKELYATCVLIPLSDELDIRCGGVMEYVKPPEKFSFKDFISAFHNDFKKEFKGKVRIFHVKYQLFTEDEFAAIAAYAFGSHWEGFAKCKNCNEMYTFITNNEVERRLFLIDGPRAICPKCKGELEFTWRQKENSSIH